MHLAPKSSRRDSASCPSMARNQSIAVWSGHSSGGELYVGNVKANCQFLEFLSIFWLLTVQLLCGCSRISIPHAPHPNSETFFGATYAEKTQHRPTGGGQGFRCHVNSPWFGARAFSPPAVSQLLRVIWPNAETRVASTLATPVFLSRSTHKTCRV